MRTGLRVITDPVGVDWGSHDAAISSIAVGLVTGRELQLAGPPTFLYPAARLRQAQSNLAQISEGIAPFASARLPPMAPHPFENLAHPVT